MSENEVLPDEVVSVLGDFVLKYGMAAVVCALAEWSSARGRTLEAISELLSDPSSKKNTKRQAKKLSLYASGAGGLERCLKYILDVS